MRLHYLRVQNVRPLQDVRLRFRQESVLGRDYALHFIVGVNGSGKTRLLQAIAELFLELEKPRLPSFPCTVAYELGRSNPERGETPRLCYLRHTGGSRSEAAFLVIDRSALPADLQTLDWDRLPETVAGDEALREAVLLRGTFNELGSGSDLDLFLPIALLAYTSGNTAAWERLFVPQETPLDVLAAPIDFEREHAWEGPAATGMGALLAGDEDLRTSSRGSFLTNKSLRLVSAALALQHAHHHRSTERSASAVIDTPFDRIGWAKTVTLGLRLTMSEDVISSLSKPEAGQLQTLYQLATFARKEAGDSDARLYVYDLDRSVDNHYDPSVKATGGATGSALWELLGGENASLLEAFRTLHRWQQIGLLDGVTVLLQKEHVGGVLSYDHLSDGERMYLGRMAALLLAHDSDDVFLILDEPETHFNDSWKREIVDVIDDAMRDRANEVVISTHSSIALTDVFDSEILLLEKAGDRADVVRTPIHTFGGTPSQIMRTLFDAGHTAGERATQYLDLILLLTEHSESVWTVWDDLAPNEHDSDWVSPDIIRDLSELKHDYGKEPAQRVDEALRALKRFAQEESANEEPSFVDALGALQQHLGQGYYEFEFLRRISHLEPGQDAAPVA